MSKLKFMSNIPVEYDGMVNVHVNEEDKTIHINIASDIWGIDEITGRWKYQLEHNSEKFLLVEVNNEKTKVSDTEISVGIGVGFIIVYANGNPPSFEETIVLNYDLI